MAESSHSLQEIKVKSYADVVNYCQSVNGIPVKITNVYENAYVFIMTQELNNVPVYIGVKRNESNNQWTYSDGTPLSYQNWAPGQPSNGDSCATLTPQSGKWQSIDCSVSLASVCSVPGVDIVTTTVKPPTTTIYSGPCLDKRWIYSNVTGYCYYLENIGLSDTILGYRWDLYSWGEAEYYCRLMGPKSGAHLASIHSKEEEDFIYQLIASNVTDWPSVEAWGNPCFLQSAWIGYYGNGLMGNGNWTDGTPVDYLGTTSINETSFTWKISNDPSCREVHVWVRVNPDNSAAAARYVCKSPSIFNMPTTTPILSTPIPTRSSNHPCYDGSLYLNVTGYCYYLQNFTKEEDDLHWDMYDWWEAEKKCQGFDGGHLVSIHSKIEDDFLYKLIASNVSSSTTEGSGEPCMYQWPWIGYFGNGTLGTGNWTDGSTVDYFGHFFRDWTPASPNQVYAWQMTNDASCKYNESWWLNYPGEANARFVCKYPPYKAFSNENDYDENGEK